MTQTFDAVIHSRSIADLENVVNANPKIAQSIREFEEKYPKASFDLSPSEVEELFKSVDRVSHRIKFDRTQAFSPFEKLLLAVLWKNGHIDRIQSIVDGIVECEREDTGYGVIFRQFGRSLINESEPIVDQHTIRAYCNFVDLPNISG